MGRPRRWTQRRFGFRYTGRDAVRIEVLGCLPEEAGLPGLSGTFSSGGATLADIQLGIGWNRFSVLLPQEDKLYRDIRVELSGSWTADNDPRKLTLLVDTIAVSEPPAVPAPEPSLSSRILGWRRSSARGEGPETATERLGREVRALKDEVARLERLLERRSPVEDPALQLGFEDNYRGPRELIKERQRVYLPFFRGRWNVLDVGSGRGEFLELLRESGSEGWGVEINPYLAAYCGGLGLRVIEDDAIAYIGTLGDGTLGGVFCAQVVEHLATADRGALLREIHAKLEPGGVLVAETVNPGCLSVFSDSFYMDASHVVPIPSELLSFELKALGFDQVRVLTSSPVEEERRLPALPAPPAAAELVSALGQWRDRLNALLFGDRDYAVVARKPSVEASSGLA